MSNLPTVRQTSGLAIHAGPSIMGEQKARLSTSGTIRPGIKRLVRKYADIPAVVEAYERGMDAGKSWAAIEIDVRKAAGLGEKDPSPLTPMNTPYLFVRRGDFAMPEIADAIMAMYGEDRNNGLGRQVYRLPVMFLIDSWLAVLPHEFSEYGGKQKRHWSQYDEQGHRRCFEPGVPVYDEKAQRYHRSYAGVPPKLREWNDGYCDTDKCEEFQTGKCKLNGKLFFTIPGIPGGSVWIPTTSKAGLNQIRSQLETTLHARGRITSRHNEPPMFFLTKVQKDMHTINYKTGESVPVKQWVPFLQLAIDITKLLPASEDDSAYIEAQGVVATQVLQGPSPDDGDDDLVSTAPEQRLEVLDREPRAPPPPSDDDDGGPSVKELQRSIQVRAHELDLPWNRYKSYALRKLRAGWEYDRKRLADALSELTSTTPETRAALLERIELDEDF